MEIQDFGRFNEAKKEKGNKWVGLGGLKEDKPKPKVDPYHYNYEPEDFQDDDDFDDSGADPDFDPDEFENEFTGGGGYGGGCGYGAYKPYVPKIGDEVTYLGNTLKKNNKTGKVHKLRDDGKVVIRFDEDRKLLAVSRQRLKLTKDPVQEEPPPPVDEPLPAGKNWWEKFKKDEPKEK